MLCDKCKQRPATVHFTKIINNQKYEQHLCEECSREMTNFGLVVDPGFSLNKFLANLLNYDSALSGMESANKDCCDNCGLTYYQFTQGGKLGCSECYSVFRERLNPLLRRVHGTGLHKGKVPERTGGKLKILKQIEALKNEMSILVVKEEFEKAAEVRDKIKELEKKIAG